MMISERQLDDILDLFVLAFFSLDRTWYVNGLGLPGRAKVISRLMAEWLYLMLLPGALAHVAVLQ